MSNINKTDGDLGWIAGFFDGEGHVSYRRSIPSKVSGKVSPSLHCSVSQSSDNIEVLKIFRDIVGFGSIKGPYPMPNGRPQHKLIFKTKEVLELFKLLRPNLKSEKTRDFQIALAQYWTHDSNPNEEDIKRMMNRNRKKLIKLVVDGDKK